MNEPVEDGEEFTELRDAVINRMDGVGESANGTQFLIAKSAKEQQHGLFAPEFVRDLIAKSQPEPQPQETVTMTGSPAAIAALIHNAPVRKAQASTASMNDRPDSDFAYIEDGGTKDESGKTTPRSLRHFPIYDVAHVRNALSRAPQSPFGDKAMPKIRAAAKKFGIDVAKADGDSDLDPTTVLAEPDGDAPGIPTDPGSPAWEAIDAATARKWTAILARACNALCVMAEREMLEAAAGDGDDAGKAFDLEDAKCAIDYAIGVLAPFAVGEQAEADLGTEVLAAVGKALDGFDPVQLDTVEALAPVAKAGRVLSAANEAAIRNAAEALQKVLASLPAPLDDSGQPVAKQIQETAMTAPTADTTATVETAVEVAKAEPEAQVAVYTCDGKLFGTVAPDAVMPVVQAEAPDDATDGEDTADAVDAVEEAAAPEVAPGEDAEVIPGTSTVAAPAPDDEQDVMKAAQTGFGPQLAEALAPIAEGLAQYAGLAEVVKGLQEQVEHLAAMPDDRKSPLLNGATGTLPADSDDALTELRKAVETATTPVARRDAEQKLAYAEIRKRFA